MRGTLNTLMMLCLAAHQPGCGSRALAPDSAPADMTVDSVVPDRSPDHGDFDGGAPDAGVPISCKLPFKLLTLTKDRVKVTGVIKASEKGSQINFTGCTIRAIYGVEHLYAARLQVGATYRASVTPAPGFDVALYAFTDCARAAATCVGGADDSYGGTGESLTFKAGQAVHFIAVDSHYPFGWPLSHGQYVLTLEKLFVPANDTCATAAPLVLKGGSAQVAGETALATDSVTLTSSGCTSYSSPGPDLFYSVDLAGGKEYAVTVTPGSSFDSMLYAFTGCGAAQQTCAAGHDNLGTGLVEAIRLKPKVNTTYTVAVDSFDARASGPFLLSVKEVRAPPNDTCQKAATLALPGGSATVTGDTSFAANTVKLPAAGCTKSIIKGPDLFYSVDLVAGKSYLINLVPDTGYNVALYLLSGCGGGSVCVAGSDSALLGLTEQLSFTPKTSGTYLVGVGSRYPGSHGLGAGKFTLLVQQWTPAQNDSCATPQKMKWSGGVATSSGDTFVATNQVSFSDSSGCSATRGEGPDLFYSVDLTAGKAYQVEVAPDSTSSTFDVAAYVFTACSGVQKSCVGGADNAAGGEAETVAIKAVTTGPHFIGVDAYAHAQWGKVTIKVTEATAPGNDTCKKAQALGWSGGEASASGSTLLATNTITMSQKLSCTSAAFKGGDLFYSVALTAGETYRFRATPGKGFDLALLLLSACGPGGVCLKGADAGPWGSAETIVFSPKTSGTAIVGVGSRYAAGTAASWGSFTLQIMKAATPVNDTCGKATPLLFSAGVAQVAGDTALATDAVKLTSSGCTTFGSPGPDLFYSLGLAGGKTYTVTLKPHSSFDSMLYAFTSCGGVQTSCVAGKDVLGDGKAEVITLSPKVKTTYTIAVDSYDAAETGTFSLTVK